MYLWEWFCELGDFSYTELHHWAQLKRVNLEAWEVDVLRRLDAIRAEVWRDRNSSPGHRG